MRGLWWDMMMWFIFPQIDGLGMSSTAKEYSIKDSQETTDYLNHKIIINHKII